MWASIHQPCLSTSWLYRSKQLQGWCAWGDLQCEQVVPKNKVKTVPQTSEDPNSIKIQIPALSQSTQGQTIQKTGDDAGCWVCARWARRLADSEWCGKPVHICVPWHTQAHTHVASCGHSVSWSHGHIFHFFFLWSPLAPYLLPLSPFSCSPCDPFIFISTCWLCHPCCLKAMLYDYSP